MLGVIVLAAIGLWAFFCVLVVGLCRAAKAGDRAMDIARAAPATGAPIGPCSAGGS
jgi:hypothetical protein